MPVETELKLLFPKDKQQILVYHLDELQHTQAKTPKQINNIYFDTDDLQLGRWEMGLRLRTVEKYREQTIKTAGQVVDGLHSRAEYNVEINENFPKLYLFPTEIWPDNADIAAVQAKLHPLFETNFSRRCWEVHTKTSLIEIALDMGEICAKGRTLPICELELELLTGEVQCLFELAKQIGKWLPVSPEQTSKAQRGYQLAKQA